MLRYHKHARIETSTTWGGFYCSLSKKLINLLLNNRMMSCSHFDIKVPKSQKEGGWDISWRWWPRTILSTNLLDIMLLHWSKNLKSIQTWNTADVDDEEDEEVEGCGTSGALTPTPTFPSSLSRTGGNSATSRLLAMQTSLIPTLKYKNHACHYKVGKKPI